MSAQSEIGRSELVSGSVFLTPETRSQQADTFENPAYFWVEAGEHLFRTSSFGEPSCVSCHDDELEGAAVTFPKIDPESGQLFNLELQINACRQRYQSKPALEYESEDLLSLTAFVANQSYSLPINVSIDGDVKRYFNIGEREFFTRRGRLNFSCAQCHNENWGKKLRGDTISQGHGNGFPAYRFEWQTVGSLHRRLQDCNTGIQAEPKPGGDPLYLALELYLTKRAEGLTIETPAIRR